MQEGYVLSIEGLVMIKKVILISITFLCLLALGLWVTVQIFNGYQNRRDKENIEILLSSLPLNELVDSLSASGFIKVTRPEIYFFNKPMADSSNKVYVFTKEFMALRIEHKDNVVVSVTYNMVEYL